MITRFQKITIIKLREPKKAINKELQWLSESLGLFSERDKERSCFRVFLAILEARRPVTSDELAYKLELSRATVIHHLHKLIAAGIVMVQDNTYALRAKNLESTLKKMKADVLSAYEEIELVAREIDKKLNI